MELLLVATTTDVERWEPTNAAAVIEQLTLARDWLREQTGLDEVIPVLSQAEAIRLLVQKRDLGREAELAAAEIVRRVERRLGELWTIAREEGRTMTNSDAGKMRTGPAPSCADGAAKLRSLDVFGNHTIRSDSLKLASVNDDDFEEAVTECRGAGVMTRAAIIRKLNGTPMKTRSTRNEWHRGKRNLDPVRIVTESLATLQGVAAGLALIQPEDVTDTARREWAREMRTALQDIERFRKGLARP